METLRPNEQRAKHAIILIWIVLAMDIASLVSGYFQYHLLQTVANGGEITTEAANANDSRERVIAIVHMVANLVSAVTFILWFRRAYFNLHQKVGNLSQPEGWAAGAWFVPIINLYRPYQIMKELYVETKEILFRTGTGKDFSTAALGWWWTLWIISNILGQFVFRYSLRAKTIDELITSTVAGMVSNIIGIPLAIITVKIISDYAKVEPLLLNAYEIGDDMETRVQEQDQ